MKEDNIFKLAQQIAELKGIVQEGFNGIHARQDSANGRTAKLEGRVTVCEGKLNTGDGIARGVRFSWGFITTLLLIIAGFAGVWAYLIK